MSKIIAIRTWNDVGYTDGCIEIPTIGKALPTPTHTYSGAYAPSKDRSFNCVQLPEPYMDLINTSYIELTYDINNATSNLILYGWVDRVEMRSDTDDYPKTDIYYHIDYWRSYNANATFGSGMVKRRSISADVPPQPYPVRYYTPGTVTNLIPGGIFWVIVNVVKNVTSGDDTFSEFETRCYPIARNNTTYYVGTSGSGNAVPTFNDTVAGRWDELWGIDPTSIVSAFISPIPPSNVSGSGTQSSPYSVYGWSAGSSGSNGFLYYKTSGSNYFGPSYPQRVDLGTTLTSDDITKYVFTGFDAEILGEIPWGMSVRYYTYRLVMSSTSCYIEFRFGSNLQADVQTGYMDARAKGLCFTLPCVAMDVTSNTWSSYVYGGQRQYDMDSRTVAAGQQAQNSLMGTVTSSGAMGAMLGSIVPGIGTVIGAVAGIASGLAGTAVTYAMSGPQNDKLQSLEDYKQSNQTNGILTPGTGWDSVFYGRVPSIVKMEVDDYSYTQRYNDISIYGAHVSEPTSSCQSLVNAGGPLQIANLIVGGPIPPEAKAYIKAKFDAGVRLI